MDSLKIQDVFEPYYAGRRRFAARKDKKLPAKAGASLAKKPPKRRPSKATNLEIEPSTDGTMEH
jgi:hypothetical protein